MTDDRAAGAKASIHHAIRCYTKGRALLDQAKNSMEVAAGLADTLTFDEWLELVHELRAADVSPRAAFTRAKEEFGPRPDEIGRTYSKLRTETLPRWPATWTPCVYVLFNHDDELLYIGKSIDLQRRMAKHYDKPWARIEFTICPTEADALALEGDLIYQHQPPLNTADRHQRRRPTTGAA